MSRDEAAKLAAQAALLDLANDAIFLRDGATGEIRYWNRGAEELYGWTAEEAVGRVSHDLLKTRWTTPPADIHRALEREGRWQGELGHTRRDGGEIAVASRWAIQRDADGHPFAYLEINRDMTEVHRLAAEQARLLRQAEAAEALSREFLESAPDGVVITDRSGTIIFVNRLAESIFGYGRDELVGQTVEVLLPERFRQHHVGHREDYVARPQTRPMGVGLDLWARRKDGAEFPVEISLSPVRSGGEMLVTSSIRDVTARRAADAELRRTAEALKHTNEELARSNADLEQFAYVASHDLQEPLRMVASYTQLLGRRYRGKLDDDADEFIHYAVDGAQRMQRLINDLLAFSRVGTRGREFEPTDAGRVVDQVVADLAPTIDEAGASVTRGDLPTVRADPSQLRQLFQNLIGNAIKFRGDAPPAVRISAEPAEGGWRFAVADNGIGIDSEYTDRVFVLFQRLHTRDRYPGTGIGLAICKKIVERHGGRIWIDSEPGRGTTFYFTIQNAPKRDGSGGAGGSVAATAPPRPDAATR